tara:strand:+ start:340 stop:2043 length:1704 start_codon:yes stop_codon:yes gene_type:complete
MRKLNYLLIILLLNNCSSNKDPEILVPPVPVIVNYTLTVNAQDGGTVNSTGGSYASGESVTITATANSEYVFTGWSNGSTTNPLTLTISSNQTITANFEKVQYSLTIATEGEGTVSELLVSSGRATDYNSGSLVRLTAEASTGWEFTGWTGDYEGTENPIELTITEAKSLTANFESIQYTLSVLASEGGTVSTEGGIYDYGTELTITATPDEGYRFDGWDGIESEENSLTIIVDSNIEISPIFNLVTQTPTSYGVDEYWGQIVDFEPEIFFSNDLPGFAREGLSETLRLITDYYGLYGPVEVWSVGRDASSSEKRELEAIFCERRSTRNDHWDRFTDYDTCISLNEFEDIGSSINGQRFFGYHIMYHRYDFTFANNSDYRHNAMTVMAHEYTHIVQAANLFTKEEEIRPDDDTRRIGWGPIFFSEGSAVYYAEFIQRKLRQNGISVENPPNVDGQGDSLRDKMREFMQYDIIPNLDSCPNFNIWDVNYSTRETCSPYRFGAWGVAYLLNKVNDQDAFWTTLWPNIDEMGWNGAFEYTFGLTMEQFNQEFLEFLELPIEQQLEIIPDI